MFCIRNLILALGLVIVWSEQGSAATNVFATNYPKAGTNNGEILVKGTATADMGKSLAGSALIIYWETGVNGGLAKLQAIIVDTKTGDYGEVTISGLTSGQEYWVIVQAIQGTNETICTPAVAIKAK